MYYKTLDLVGRSGGIGEQSVEVWRCNEWGPGGGPGVGPVGRLTGEILTKLPPPGRHKPSSSSLRDINT